MAIEIVTKLLFFKYTRETHSAPTRIRFSTFQEGHARPPWRDPIFHISHDASLLPHRSGFETWTCEKEIRRKSQTVHWKLIAHDSPSNDLAFCYYVQRNDSDAYLLLPQDGACVQRGRHSRVIGLILHAVAQGRSRSRYKNKTKVIDAASVGPRALSILAALLRSLSPTRLERTSRRFTFQTSSKSFLPSAAKPPTGPPSLACYESIGWGGQGQDCTLVRCHPSTKSVQLLATSVFRVSTCVQTRRYCKIGEER